jgi:Ni/Fe-hydrogenase subunit HybB-like protein
MPNKIYKQKWSFSITPVRLILIAISLLGLLLITYRLVTGLGTVTNMNDEWPWGFWIAFDVMCGVALAGGGYGTALLIYVLRMDYLKPIARAAMLTSLIGYVLVAAGLLLDVGQWFNFWKPFISWGHTSVLFEVFLCITAYTIIQFLEFGEIFTERVGKKYHDFFKKIMPALIIIGIMIPTMHQSSLGALYLMMVDKLYALWWSPIIFLFFLLSSFFVGPAMVVVESSLSAKAFGHKIELGVLKKLVRIGGYVMLIYLVLKIGDLIVRGKINYLFNGNFENYFFVAELVIGIILPLIICFSSLSNSRGWLTLFGVLTSAGLVFNRLNVVVTGMVTSAGSTYFPAVSEAFISLALVSMGVLVYLFVCANFSILRGGEPVNE